MNDKILLKISLLTAVVGIFLLFIFLQKEEVRYMSVIEFKNLTTCQNINLKNVFIIGLVEKIDENNKTILLDLVEYKRIQQKAIYFKENAETLGINDGDIVEIKGNWFNGKLILNSIEKVNISH
jgi:hypothetical protein